jgi:hypothetical protein
MVIVHTIVSISLAGASRLEMLLPVPAYFTYLVQLVYYLSYERHRYRTRRLDTFAHIHRSSTFDEGRESVLVLKIIDYYFTGF